MSTDPGLVSAAEQLIGESDVIDLHIEAFLSHSLLGYDLNRHHTRSYTGGRFVGHIDFPRAVEAGLTGAMWSISTNPFKTQARRWKKLLSNIDQLRAQIEASNGTVRIATTFAQYQAAKAEAQHICLPAIQGANSLAGAPSGAADIPNRFITRVTLMHLTNSLYGVTSSPLGWLKRNRGLTGAARDLIRDLESQRIFVDLAHINRAGFWDAVECHDPSLPLLATHTGVCGVTPYWRNLDDKQVKAIADSGGTVGIIFEHVFLRRPDGPRDARMVIEHIAHVVDTVGEDFVSIGSDYDGLITPPKDLRHRPDYTLLVQWMLKIGWSSERITKILGQNFLRCFKMMRPD